MDQIVTTITDVSNKLLPLGASLAIIGIIVGLLMTVVGYRHGSDVMRTSAIAMIFVLAIPAISSYFKAKLGTGQ